MLGADFAGVLTGAQAGDDQAFVRLWRDSNPSVVRYLRVVAGPAADDLASETWLAVMRGLTSFRGGESQFRSWLFTVARSKVVDAHRRDRSDRRQPLDSVGMSSGPVTEDAADAAQERMSTEQALALIGRLPAEQAEIIVFRVVAGLDVAQVAKIVGKREGAVRVAAHRGLRHLAKLLSEGGVTDREVAAFRSRDA